MLPATHLFSPGVKKNFLSHIWLGMIKDDKIHHYFFATQLSKANEIEAKRERNIFFSISLHEKALKCLKLILWKKMKEWKTYKIRISIFFVIKGWPQTHWWRKRASWGRNWCRPHRILHVGGVGHPRGSSHSQRQILHLLWRALLR